MGVAEVLGGACLLIGAVFSIISGIGVLRFPDFYTRMHAAGISDTMTAGFILVGLCFYAGLSLITAKLLFILFFLFVTSPTAAHALAKAGLTAGVRPHLHKKGGSSSTP